MAIYRENIINIDLERGAVPRSFANQIICEGDAKGDRFGVYVMRNAQEVDLTGVSVSGQFIRSNGTTVAISGSRSGSRCWVELPAACYAIEGAFTLSIKLTIGDVTMTARIIDGTIIDTVVGDIVDPGTVIPDLADWTALVERAEAAADKIESFSISAGLITGTRYKIGVINAT